MALLYARGIFDPEALNGNPKSQPEPGNPPLNANTTVVDQKLRRFSRALVSRVFYTSNTPVLPEFDLRDGQGFAFANTAQYAAAVPPDATRNNAHGYAQLLYLDVFAAGSQFHPNDETGASDIPGDSQASAPVVLYWHGGGFTSGYANNREGYVQVVAEACAKGFHVVVAEYRRGWVPLSPDPTEGNQPNDIGVSAFLRYDQDPPPGTQASQYNGGNGLPLEARRDFERTALGTGSMAIDDALDACLWTQENIRSLLPAAQNRYIHWGNSAGGSLALQLTVAAGPRPDNFTDAWRSHQKRVVLACPNFGSVRYDFLFSSQAGVSHRVPVAYNTCGIDQLSPVRNAPLFWNDTMPVALGSMDLYRRLDELGYRVVQYHGPVDGHGYGSWQIGGVDGHIEHLRYALAFGRRLFDGLPVPRNHILHKVPNDRAGQGLNQCFGFPAPGYYCTLDNQAEADLLYSERGHPNAPFSLGVPLAFYDGAGPTDRWHNFWFGEWDDVQNSYRGKPDDPNTSVGLISTEGQACRTSTGGGSGNCPPSLGGAPPIGLHNTNYIANFDRRACDPNTGQ